MFNLLFSGDDEAFLGQPWELKRDRVFEYTSEAIRNQFQELNSQQISRLCNFPTLLAYERGINQNARLGKIDHIRIRQTEVRIEYSFIEGLPEITPAQLKDLEWELDIAEFEFNRTHWAVKDVDLAAELISAGLMSKEQVDALNGECRAIFIANGPDQSVQVQPSVFRMPEGQIEHDLVSVMFPFNEAFYPVFNLVERAGKDLGLRVLNANQVWNESEIIQDIFSLIFRSKFVICDFSTRNPNVFYEAGIAHTLGRPVIPIVQNVEDIPFDLRHHRHIVYLNNDQGRLLLLKKIKLRMQTLAGRGQP
ncbi:hypothetical protein LPB140_03390 [Sphingorhabdus lutea]|uniref:AbiJ N-terminal domain-containing protein n=1 Tax=Sphingorhabdus lutea TaxID=1913578 RepID=A0A1L3JA64_9SPHN|nr:hypothetical protein [Sphingorhabdus lutea]APG62017.1 hypothetical protein LPB140_03390 [Sphingorhabdus lutea]